MGRIGVRRNRTARSSAAPSERRTRRALLRGCDSNASRCFPVGAERLPGRDVPNLRHPDGSKGRSCCPRWLRGAVCSRPGSRLGTEGDINHAESAQVMAAGLLSSARRQRPGENFEAVVGSSTVGNLLGLLRGCGRGAELLPGVLCSQPLPFPFLPFHVLYPFSTPSASFPLLLPFPFLFSFLLPFLFPSPFHFLPPFPTPSVSPFISFPLLLPLPFPFSSPFSFSFPFLSFFPSLRLLSPLPFFLPSPSFPFSPPFPFLSLTPSLSPPLFPSPSLSFLSLPPFSPSFFPPPLHPHSSPPVQDLPQPHQAHDSNRKQKTQARLWQCWELRGHRSGAGRGPAALRCPNDGHTAQCWRGAEQHPDKRLLPARHCRTLPCAVLGLWDGAKQQEPPERPNPTDIIEQPELEEARKDISIATTPRVAL